MLEPNKKINWFPGHMKKTFDAIDQNLKVATLIVECVDARIPISSRNPVLYEKIKSKPLVTVYTKSDLAGDFAGDFAGDGSLQNMGEQKQQKQPTKNIFKINANTGDGIRGLQKFLKSLGREGEKEQRIIIVGIPNSGKSSLINRLVSKKKVGVGDRPGFTKRPTWIKYTERIHLLDTPGVLWPKIETKRQAENLAITGAIKPEVIDEMEIAAALIKRMTEDDPLVYLSLYGKKRGFLLSGGEIDIERASKAILSDYRKGKFKNIKLE